MLYFRLALNPPQDQTRPKSSNSTFSCLLWAMRFKFPTLMPQDSVLMKLLYSTSSAPSHTPSVEKCATIPKKYSRFTTSERGQNSADLPNRLPPTKRSVTWMWQTKVESAVNSKGSISCTDTFLLRTETKFGPHGFM